MKHETVAAGGNKPVHTASGNGVAQIAPEDVELAEVQILAQRRTIRASRVKQLYLTTGPRPLVPPGQWVLIVEGGVTRLLHPAGLQLTPKGQSKQKGEVS